MSNSLYRLIQQREVLVARCAEQRDQLAQAIDGVQRETAPYQLALRVWRAVKSHPLLFGLAAVVTAVAGPRRLVSMLGTSLTFYSLVRRVTQFGRRQ